MKTFNKKKLGFALLVFFVFAGRVFAEELGEIKVPKVAIVGDSYAGYFKHYLTVKGVKYNDVADIIEIYLTKEDFFKKGSTVYQVRMEVVLTKNVKKIITTPI